MFNFINLQKENIFSSNISTHTKESLKDEKLIIDNNNYYFSNVIARASKTMIDCHNAKLNIKKTGTEG